MEQFDQEKEDLKGLLKGAKEIGWVATQNEDNMAIALYKRWRRTLSPSEAVTVQRRVDAAANLGVDPEVLHKAEVEFISKHPRYGLGLGGRYPKRKPKEDIVEVLKAQTLKVETPLAKAAQRCVQGTTDLVSASLRMANKDCRRDVRIKDSDVAGWRIQEVASAKLPSMGRRNSTNAIVAEGWKCTQRTDCATPNSGVSRWLTRRKETKTASKNN
jgi:hypothetical protein